MTGSRSTAAQRNQSHSRLQARGCLCGTERPADCRLHPAGDNRGIAAWFKAGMPSGFPTVAMCAICGAGGLLYPDVDLDDPRSEADGIEHRPTLICPRCSSPAAERWLVNQAERFGYVLNPRRVFALATEESAQEELDLANADFDHDTGE